MKKLGNIPRRSPELAYTQQLVMGFALIAAAGTVLLMLPVASAQGESTTLINAMLTAVSASCVTGLIAYDTYTHWSMFGKAVILLLIQLGGLGFMTFIAVAAMAAKKKITLKQKELMQEAVNAGQVGGIVRLFGIIIKGTVICELAGTALLAVRFIPMLGVGEGLFYALFHSVSAFCNGGFDLMGRYEQFSSLTLFKTDVYLNIVIMLLITVGGLGFAVWDDILQCRFRFTKFRLHTKLVVVTSLILVTVPSVLFFVFERNSAFGGLGLGRSAMAAVFEAVTLRTAGFNTVDQAALSDSSVILAYIIMLIGGSPGSTAGGIKTTTAAVIVLSAIADLKNDKHVTAFGRRLDDELLRKVIAILSVYLFISFSAIAAICFLEDCPFRAVCYEVFSAVGTVGLSMGLTPSLCTASKVILSFLMFFGRVGGLSMAMVFARPYVVAPLTYPEEKISVG